MTEGNDKLKAKLEATLRLWGVEEAARTAPMGSAPRARPVRVATPSWSRWAPLAGAAVLLLAAGSLFLLTGTRRGAADLRASAQVAEQSRQELAGLQADLHAAQAELTAAKQLLKDEQDKRLALQKQGTDPALPAQRQQQLDSPQESVKQLQADLKGREEKLREVSASLEQAQSAVTAKERELAQARQVAEAAQAKANRLEGGILGASEEVAKLRKSVEDAQAAARKAEGELAVMKIHRAAMTDYFQQAYLALGQQPSGPTARGSVEALGLRARQEVVRRSRILDRCVKIRPVAQSEPTRQLLDRLEVVLTRLEMLDVQDPTAVEAFLSLLKRTEVPGELDKATSSDSEDIAVRTWLFEVMLILRGANRVG